MASWWSSHRELTSARRILTRNGRLHTNFLLNSDGEYLALAREDGTPIFEFAEEFPALRADVSFGVSPTDASELAYFLQPTPGAPNQAPLAGVVADTKFSINRGFFDTPF